MQPLAEQIIVEILSSEMNLPVDTIWIRDQNKVYPNTDNLFVVVGMVNSKVVSSNNETIPTTTGMQEIQSVITQDEIQIDILSRDTSAVFRRWEVIAALESVFSEQLQEFNNFKIFPIPVNFVNTSQAEGGSQINRFTITFTVQTWYKKYKILSSIYGDYFDEFSVRVDDEITIGTDNGIVEFTEPNT